MDREKRKKALEIGMELFDTQQGLIEMLTDFIRAQVRLDRALEGMTEEERAVIAEDMVRGVKAHNDEAIAEAASMFVDDGSTKH